MPSKNSPKIQRWVDLLAALLARRQPATFEEPSRDVPAYLDGKQSKAAQMRMFERDEDELRAFASRAVGRRSFGGESQRRMRNLAFDLPVDCAREDRNMHLAGGGVRIDAAPFGDTPPSRYEGHRADAARMDASVPFDEFLYEAFPQIAWRGVLSDVTVQNDELEIDEVLLPRAEVPA